MTINPKDDYNTLGSLFYPSIEASGNVYYGQTRKLAINGLFNTNDGGFSQCVVARPLDSDEKYFSWELGPLKGCLKVFNDFYDSDNIYFAKYNIKVKDESVVYEVIDSGQFPTYSKSVYVELDKDQPYVIGAINPVTINDPEKAEAWDGRNFYVDVDKKTLYIAIAKDSLKKEITKAMTYPSQEELEQPLTFENTGTETTYIRLYKIDQEKNANTYEYRTINENGDENDWTLQSNYDELDKNTITNVIFSENTVADSVQAIDGSIRLKPGCKVQYRLAGEYSQPTSSDANVRFMAIQRSMPGGLPEDPNLSLSGNIASMIAQDSKIYSTIKNSSGYYYCHSKMFYSCKCIKSAKDLIIPYEVVSSELYQIFSLCTSLLYAPHIYIKKMVKNRLHSASGLNESFSYCSSLLEPPPILPMANYIESDVHSAYSQMFYRCYSLHKVPLIPLTKCTRDGLFYMFRECSDLTQMPVILSSELNNLYYGGLYSGRKSLQGAFVGTKIKAIYCAAVLDSNPSSKPKFLDWLPDTVEKIYVPSDCPDNFWESADEAYAGKIVKINDEMDANEYPEYWVKNESEDLLLVDDLLITKSTDDELSNFTFSKYNGSDAVSGIDNFERVAVQPTNKSGSTLHNGSGSSLSLLNFVYKTEMTSSLARLCSCESDRESSISTGYETEIFSYEELVYDYDEDTGDSEEYYETITDKETKHFSKITSEGASISVESYESDSIYGVNNSITAISDSITLCTQEDISNAASICMNDSYVGINADEIWIHGTTNCVGVECNSVKCTGTVKCERLDGLIPMPSNDSDRPDLPVGSICAVGIQTSNSSANSMPLTFRALGNSAKVKWTKHGNSTRVVHYKLYDEDGHFVSESDLSPDESVKLDRHQYIRVCNKDSYTPYNPTSSPTNYCTFDATGEVEVSGNINSLLVPSGANFESITDLTAYGNWCFYKLFNGEIKIASVVLPATTLTYGCYQGLFSGCRVLVIGPEELPATTLANYCYRDMFRYCYKLRVSPKIKVSKIEMKSYFTDMFQDSYIDTIFLNVSSVAISSTKIDNWIYSGNLPTVSGTIYVNEAITDLDIAKLNIPNSWRVVKKYSTISPNGCDGFMIHPGTTFSTGKTLSYRSISAAGEINDDYILRVGKIRSLYMTQSNAAAYMSYNVSNTPYSSSYEFTAISGAIQSSRNAAYIYLLAIRTK